MRRLASSFAVQFLLVTLVLSGGLIALQAHGAGNAADPSLAPAGTAAPAPDGQAPEDGLAAGAGTKDRPGAASPRRLFAHTCGMCHALRAADAQGRFGPDLDAERPSAARVRRMIRTGSLDGIMQPRLLEGADARRMARYVARVAGT